MKDEEQKMADKKECEHEWKALGTKSASGIKHGETFVELVCIKCGAKKEIELFP